MDNLDGKLLSNMRQWRCEKNSDHILGVIERVTWRLQVRDKILRYETSRLIIFHEAIDINAEIPPEIEVQGSLDGKTLNMFWKCSCCGTIKEWHPGNEVVEFLAKTYLSE